MWEHNGAGTWDSAAAMTWCLAFVYRAIPNAAVVSPSKNLHLLVCAIAVPEQEWSPRLKWSREAHLAGDIASDLAQDQVFKNLAIPSRDWEKISAQWAEAMQADVAALGMG